MNGIDKNYDLNFDRGMYELLKEKWYIRQVCDDLIALSKKVYGEYNYEYCCRMLYNSCIAPWCGILPQLRSDVSTVIRDHWTTAYLTAYRYGRDYLSNIFYEKGWTIHFDNIIR